MSQSTKAKVIFLGDSGVGKTSIVLMQEKRRFEEVYTATMGATFIVSTVQIANEYVHFQVWDTAGQERFRSMVPMYLRNSKAAIIVYDITNRQSFKNVHAWIQDIQRWVPESIQIVILGNKSDLAHSRVVARQEGEDIARLYGCTSAKLDQNIDAPFVYIAEQMILSRSNSSPEKNMVFLDNNRKQKKGCCGK